MASPATDKQKVQDYLDGRKAKIVYLKTSDLIPYAKNARVHSKKQVKEIVESIKEFGFKVPVLVDGKNEIIAGHGRVMAAQSLKMPEVPCLVDATLSPAQIKAYRIADNKLAMNSTWDDGILGEELIELYDADFDVDKLGFSGQELDGLIGPAEEEVPKDEKYPDGKAGALVESFIVPPFSVLDTRQGYWQERREVWKGFGIDSGKGRGAALMGSFFGTSIFDPVLAEVLLTWFCGRGGRVLDPFAGGSVRGIVAAWLGYRYVGFDVRAEQIEANVEQAEVVLRDKLKPTWVCDNSLYMDRVVNKEKFDFIMTCPPYFDLEKYSDNKGDLSTLDDETFRNQYKRIIEKAVDKLDDNRFAVYVVGEVRDKKGHGIYKNLVGLTIDSFQKAGAAYYNEIVLVNSAGTLPLRAGKMFNKARKVGKCHQNVLVFVKGDPKLATRQIVGNVPQDSEKTGNKDQPG